MCFPHQGLVNDIGGSCLVVMHDDSKSQEMIEQKIKNAPPGQGIVRMLTRDEWKEIREVRPRTPFKSKLARPNARIRIGEPLHKKPVYKQHSEFRVLTLVLIVERIGILVFCENEWICACSCCSSYWTQWQLLTVYGSLAIASDLDKLDFETEPFCS
ncbi:hypothetical protein REPUB_Repub14bG0009700 [Reevesia pubescens]